MFNAGILWRAVFKKLLWLSVIIFEGIVILIANLSQNIPARFFGYYDVYTFVMVMIIIVGTIINLIVHCIWGCIAYMFEDIAETKMLVSMYVEYRVESDKMNDTDEASDESFIDTMFKSSSNPIIKFLNKLNEPSTDTSEVMRKRLADMSENKSNSGNSRSDLLSRLSDNDYEPQPRTETWTCRKCGRENPMLSTFCKDCGEYK